jgi:plastocyanin
MFTKPLTLFLFSTLAAAVAQNYGGAPANAPASSSSSATSAASTVAPTAPADTTGQMNIDVAFNKGLVFNPSNISAPVGTLVTFYYPNFGITHSVTQSSFDAPCTYLAANTTANTPAGFDSGLQAAATFTINITDTSPIWFFCKQSTHCGMGMVGSINAPATGDLTYDAYLAAAKKIGVNEQPTPDNGPVLGGVHATATGSPVPNLTATSSSGSSSTTSGAMKSIGFALFAAVLGIAMA